MVHVFQGGPLFFPRSGCIAWSVWRSYRKSLQPRLGKKPLQPDLENKKKTLPPVSGCVIAGEAGGGGFSSLKTNNRSERVSTEKA